MTKLEIAMAYAKNDFSMYTKWQRRCRTADFRETAPHGFASDYALRITMEMAQSLNFG